MYKLELAPNNGRKSFYGKAVVKVYEDGTQILQSYDTDVLMKNPDGTYARLWSGWTCTTGTHVKAFSGMDKAHYLALPCMGDVNIAAS